jgi:AraC family transcriptional regulator
MQTTTVRDLHDWVTGFAVLQELVPTKLASPPTDYSASDARLSSRSLGWRGLSFDQEELAVAGSRPPQSAGRHLVIVSLGRGRIVVTGTQGLAEHEMQPGSVAVYPTDQAVRWSAPSPLRCCVLGLDAAMLDRVATATYRAAPGDFELVPAMRAYDFGIVGLAGVLAEEAVRGARGNNLYVNSLANTLAVHLLRHYAKWRCKGLEGEKLTAFERTLNAPEPVQRAILYIRENHTRDIGVQQIAEAAATNPFQLARMFDERLGTAPFQYLLQMRMQSANSLLAAGARSLPEVTEAVGFGDQGHLIGREGLGVKQGLGARGVKQGLGKKQGLGARD